VTDALHRLQKALSRGIARAAATLSAPLRVADLRLHRALRLALVFAPLLLALLVTVLLMLRISGDVADGVRVVAHAHDVEEQVTVLEAALTDLEVGQRDYLLTGDATYLPPYAAARAATVAGFAQLQALTAADAPQQSRIARLKPLVARLLALQQQTIDLRTQQRTDAAVALMRSAESAQTRESTRALLADMDEAETRVIDSRLRAASGRLFGPLSPLILALVADALLLVVVFVLLRGAFAARERHLRSERAARAEAEAALTLRDQFLTVASHELRTPIAALLHNVELLERRLARKSELGEQLRQSFAAMHRQLARLQSLIAAMLDVSRIERGQLNIAHDPVDLADMVRSVVDEVRPTTPAHPIELIAPPGAILVRGDAVRLSQVLLNLLQNAIKYSPDGGPIRVEVVRAADGVSVSITDRGIGIPPDALPHLFERFYRAPAVRSEHISGMGIGLYVVREIVALHGGKVTVSSTAGVGSTFTVHLPPLDEQH
jgi:signal transduction histidine kinase